MPSTTELLPAVETYAARRWPVLPCHHVVGRRCSCREPDCASPAKHPRTRRGLHAATTDLAVLRRWWRTWPIANPAVRTGSQPDGAGLVVLDIDPAHGGQASLAALVAVHGPLPATLETRTGNGGAHLYFDHPGGHVANSAGRLGAGLDVRGDGGYVLVPPSRHASGRRYRWIERPIQPMPSWLADLVRRPAPVLANMDAPAVQRATKWAQAAVAGELARVRHAPVGCRNHTLNRAAFALGQLIGGDHLDIDTVTAALTDTALAAGLTLAETRATIASGLRAGAEQPRRRAAAP